jgi:hypothetical protein
VLGVSSVHSAAINSFAELELAGRNDLTATVLQRHLERAERGRAVG